MSLKTLQQTKKLTELTNLEVKELQRLLNDLNYDVGTSGIDGILGPNTERAYAQFKKDNYFADPELIGKGTVDVLYKLTSSTISVDIIKEFEGFMPRAYVCPAGVLTIGYGTTIYSNGNRVLMGDTISETQAETELLHYVNKRIVPVLSEKIPYWREMNNNQKSALVSFAYNLGEYFYGDNGFKTITRVLKNKEWSQVPKALMLYVNPGSSFEAGLRRRRKKEGELWSKK